MVNVWFIFFLCFAGTIMDSIYFVRRGDSTTCRLHGSSAVFVILFFTLGMRPCQEYVVELTFFHDQSKTVSSTPTTSCCGWCNTPQATPWLISCLLVRCVGSIDSARSRGQRYPSGGCRLGRIRQGIRFHRPSTLLAYLRCVHRLCTICFMILWLSLCFMYYIICFILACTIQY